MTSITEAALASSTLAPAYATAPAASYIAPVAQPQLQQQAQVLAQQQQQQMPATTTGGGAQAVQGASQLNNEQLLGALQQLIGAVQQLAAALQAQQQGGGVSGGVSGGGGGVGACGMPNCTMVHEVAQSGAAGAPTTAEPVSAAASASRPAPASAAATPARRVDASSVKDKTSTNGLTAMSKRGLEEAHTFGLPLVSGKRSGSGTSDHNHGNAIDVGTLPIGVASSDGGTSQMKAFAEHMRQQGKAGKLDVKYVIADGKIASASKNWEWRPYTYPGKSESQLAELKQSNRGEFNRIQHYDHVHVSFG